MSASPESPSDLFLSYSRQKLVALLIVTLVVGAVGLALVVTPTGSTWRSMADDSLVVMAQFPLAVSLGFMAELVPPRGPIVMAMATVMIGLVSRIGLFLWYDREAS